MANPDGATPGRPGNTSAGAGRFASWGDPGSESSAIPKGRLAGQPVNRPVGTAERREIRGDSEIRHRQKPDDEGSGATRGTHREALQEDEGTRGDPRVSQKPAVRKDQRFGATRTLDCRHGQRSRKRGNSWNRSSGAEPSCGVRGNPETHNVPSRKDAGNG